MPKTKVSSRRSFLIGSLALASPWIVGRARASSERLNILIWSDYLPEPFLAGFTGETGITVNHTSVGSNEEIFARLQANPDAYDLISPTNQRSLQWEPLDLLQPFDMTRVNVDSVNPAMLKIGTDTWNFGGTGTHWLPHVWGTEGIAYRTDRWQPSNVAPSYGDVWSEELSGKTMGRTQSMLVGAGLFLEAREELARGSVWAAYGDPDTMADVWTHITDWAIARKSRINRLWNDAETQRAALLGETVTLGQTWDGPPLALKSQGAPVHYQAPVEGAMAWVDGLALPKGAQNIDAVYAFINYAYRADAAGVATKSHGYNSCVLGADRFAGAAYAKNFAEAYPGDSLANLHPWPAEAPWYAAKRAEFVAKFENA